MANVKLLNITKTYLKGKVKALENINLEISHGQFLTILGPSGCGKTTILRLIAGLEKPDTGKIYIGEREVTHLSPKERDVAMVFQNYALYPHMKVYENIAIGLRLRKLDKKEIEKRVKKVSNMLGIEELLDRYPSQLSGGQQQRVALARAIVRKPSVFLLDEPLSNLDASLRETTRVELKRLFKELKATVIYVTHDQVEAMTMSDIIVIMNKGKILQIGEPLEIYKKPAFKFVAEFVGTPKINVIPGKIQNGKFISEDNSIIINLPIEHSGEVILGIRPENIYQIENKGEVEKDKVILKGKILTVEPLGSQEIVSLLIGKYNLRFIKNTSHPLNKSEIFICFSTKDILLFEKSTEKLLEIMSSHF